MQPSLSPSSSSSLTRDDRNSEIVRDHGILPLVSLISNGNDYIILQTLLVLLNLTHYGTHPILLHPTFILARLCLTPNPPHLTHFLADESRQMVSMYLDKEVLQSLFSSNNITLRQLSHALNHSLGF